MERDVLHVVQRLARGGAGRALLSLAAASRDAGGYRHRVLSLVEPDLPTQKLAADQGMELTVAADRRTTARLAAAADVVQIHFWNTPELYAFLRGPQPCGRLVLWSHIHGATAPHVITDALLAYPDAFVATTAATLDLPVLRRSRSASVGSHRTATAGAPGVTTTVIRAGPDLRRAAAGNRRSGGRFTVGVFGSLDTARLDPNLLEVFAALHDADAQMLVVGAGDAVPQMQKRAADLGISDRITWVGFSEDVGPHLAQMDVALHLLRKDSSATSDLALQELMAAAVVPIVSEGSAPADLLRPGTDGFVAPDTESAAEILRQLAADRSRRQRIGAAARRRAHAEFDAPATAAAFHDLYAHVLERPRREHRLAGGADPTTTQTAGWQRFVESLGEFAEPFRCSAVGSSDCDVEAADRLIATSPPAVVGPGAGGVLHYRGYYPNDPVLRYWAGLLWAHRGRPALAAADFAFARSAGFDPRRVERHLAEILDIPSSAPPTATARRDG